MTQSVRIPASLRALLVRRGAMGFALGFVSYALILWGAISAQGALFPAAYGRQRLIFLSVSFLARFVAGALGGALLGAVLRPVRAVLLAVVVGFGNAIGGLLSFLIFGALAGAGSGQLTLLDLLLEAAGPALTGALIGLLLGVAEDRGREWNLLLGGMFAFVAGFLAWSAANDFLKILARAFLFAGGSGFWFLFSNLLANAIQGAVIGAILGAVLSAGAAQQLAENTAPGDASFSP